MNLELKDIIFQKRRFNRLEFTTKLFDDIEGKVKGRQLNIIEEWEMDISELLKDHIEQCTFQQECDIEQVYGKALKILELKKEEVLQQNTFWENIITNPVGLGILFIGIGNIALAIINLFK